MALEWGALALVVAAEGILLLFATFPGSHKFVKGIVAVLRSALQPLLSIVPFALFLLLDLYWKYENHPRCEGPSCTIVEREHHAKSQMKSQRNLLLVIAALFLYWVLYRVTAMLVRIDHLQRKTKIQKDGDDEDSD
ncbi:hypothetical protein SELMODRAFT_407584 [Selaginella moellendorffii]|uniref:Endoplasmic reticulum transmembrane protein n=2 Tax=Selaginella moellendorffii TaxID=88036 RepID=D8R629_SELML|nr:uncharacterized protein LOC9652343 [Selaginella moellendorffii]EFJ16535.1 hypothetical protein SELMODRAFT_233969 [Selaginella moellendorffii]EFJ32248.1 hypothetical protein SELMODRAFT_407584 [Selaginella moellendorffii]|eukprot:XP_002966221.1 uncharacterized protein LOC9652343 [Selaginella moellendorffii]